MSVFSIFTAGLACFASLASAYTPPSGDAPSGNPITTPGFGSIVSVGKPYTIRWDPTTEGKVSLVLLKGPAQNLAVVGAIAESIDNSGSYSWTPASDLTEGPTATTGYGIQLIVEGTGQYQYTTQFGISNPQGGASYGDSSSASGSASAPGYPVSTSAAASSSHDHDHNWPSTSVVTISTSDAAPSSSAWAESSTVVVVVPTSSAAATTLQTVPASASVAPTKATVTPSGTAPTRTATSTGGAANLKSGLVGMAALAGAAVLVM